MYNEQDRTDLNADGKVDLVPGLALLGGVAGLARVWPVKPGSKARVLTVAEQWERGQLLGVTPVVGR